MTRPIRKALISVFSKEGLAPIVEEMHAQGIELISTGGTQRFIEALGIPVQAVEELTNYPAILDGRVKTLHPAVFGGILARDTEDHKQQLDTYSIPPVDCVVVDLYPFEETIAQEGVSEQDIIEKIDIGGIALIRAAAKNFERSLVIPSRRDYSLLGEILSGGGTTDLDLRKQQAIRAFDVSSHYDSAIYRHFTDRMSEGISFKSSVSGARSLRYGENPHQEAKFYGPFEDLFTQLNGKALSYNNLVDLDAAFHLMREFEKEKPTVAVLKHTNPCGLATRTDILSAWKAALAGDPISAFGGVIIANRPIDLATAQEIDSIFYELLIAPEFEADALELLAKKKKRVLLKVHSWNAERKQFKSLLNGVIEQDMDLKSHQRADWKCVTSRQASDREMEDLMFANVVVKHLKSNTIALVKNQQLVGMGCGQTSRVDALHQAIHKAKKLGFELEGAVMASDAFFPFPDCVEIAHEEGILTIVQPGGSIKDQDSIDYCEAHGQAMYLTSVRHFKH
jgi:phosphoribosylaminoimidazolecarboxamide formyltransferase/IMP cyclohydrolase